MTLPKSFDKYDDYEDTLNAFQVRRGGGVVLNIATLQKQSEE